jgi:hypothetical protein
MHRSFRTCSDAKDPAPRAAGRTPDGRPPHPLDHPQQRLPVP